MKKREAIELYNVLDSCKLTGMVASSKRVVLKNLSKLRPVSETYESDRKNAVEKLKPEGFDDIIKKATEHNESVKNGGKPVMSIDELRSAALVIDKYNIEVNDFVNSLLDEDAGIEMDRLDDANLDVLLDANDMEAGKLALIQYHMSK